MAITINGTGSITGLTAGGLPDGSITSADLASGAITAGALPSGSILQVVQTTKTDTTSTVSTSYTDISGMSRTITPVAADSNILVMVMVSLGADGAIAANGYVQILRGSTDIFSGTAASRTSASVAMMAYGTGSGADFHYSTLTEPITYLDDPTYTLGDELTYKLQWATQASNGTLYLNRSDADDTTARPSTVSSIILMEVAN